MVKAVAGGVEGLVAGLCFGDVVQVDWLDASEVTGRFLGGDGSGGRGSCGDGGGFDTPVRSLGYFLGVRGKRCRHVVIAKEIIRTGEAFHYNVIPFGMVQAVRVLAKNTLERETRRRLKKFVGVALRRRFDGKDGWMVV